MKYFKKFILDYSFLSVLILVSGITHIYYSFELWKSFESNCVNKEFLTWDPELRFILTLKMMDNLRNWNLFSYLGQVLDAPHWPSLRNVFESLLFLVTSPEPKYTIFITYCFYVFLPIALFTVLWLDKIQPIIIGLFIFIFVLGLSQAESLQLYAFTGMMELQGAFFFSFVAYYVSKIYTTQTFPENKPLGWSTFVFTTLLFHTKYPYGYLLLLCIVFLELLHISSTLQYAKEYFAYFRKGWYKNFRFWIALLATCLLFLPKTYLTGKLPNYLRYTIVLFVVIDVFLFFYKTPTTQENSRIHFLLKWIIFPILFWMLAQPDRFGSYSGQITHVETQGNNPGEAVSKNLDYYLLFVDEFLMNGFRGFALPFFLLFGNLFIIGYSFLQAIQKKTLNKSFYIAFLCIFTILELSLFTSNRLARHIYHLYPAMFLSIFFFIVELQEKHKILSYVVVTTFLVLVAYPVALKPIDFVSKVEVCYTGYDQKDYLKPKWIAEKSEQLLRVPTIILNEVNPYHVNKADTEYLITRVAYKKEIPIYFDPKRWKKVDSKWKELWIVGDTCEHKTFLEKKDFWEANGFYENNAKIYREEFACIVVIPKTEK